MPLPPRRPVELAEVPDVPLPPERPMALAALETPPALEAPSAVPVLRSSTPAGAHLRGKRVGAIAYTGRGPGLRR